VKKPQEIRTFLGEKTACANGRSLRTQESSFSRPQLLQSKQHPTQQARDSTPCRAHAPTVMPPTGMTDGEGLRLRPVQQRLPVRRHQRAPSKAEREAKLAEFRDFSASLKLRSPIPLDVVSRSVRDPLKQKEIHEVALRDILEPPGSTARKSSNAHHQAAYNHRPCHCPVAYASPPYPCQRRSKASILGIRAKTRAATMACLLGRCQATLVSSGEVLNSP
jgi:hypothetical protein